MRSLALIALLGMTGCEASPQYEHVHAATLTLKIGDSGCSGTAVGRYQILTASHCIAAQTGKPDRFATLTANGKLCEVWKAIHDGNDHALLTVSCEFKAWAGLTNAAKAGGTPKLGAKVFMFGSPLDFTDLLRFGRVAGKQGHAMPGMGTATIIDIVGGPGDSGAGIFNTRGQVVGVLSIGNRHIALMGIFPLAFSKAQLKAAGL